MKRLLILVLLFFTLTHSQAQQQRLIVYGGVPWFAFDPITNSYQKGSLSQIWGYAEAWREELGDTDFFLMAHPDFLAQMPDSYRLYHECSGDSVMLSQIHSYIGLRDSVSSSFDLGRFLPDTIAQGELLVIDKWEMFGDVTLKAKMVDIRDFPNSSEFLSAQDHNIQTLRRYFSTPIVELDTVFTTEDCYFGASHLSGLFHRYQLETTGADLSLFAPSRQQFSWSAGGLYVKDIFQMLVYDNQLTVVTVSGALVLEFLEQVYGSRYYTVRRESDDMVRLRTPYYLHESLAGAEYMVNLTKGKGKRIENHTIDENREYRLAINSFRSKWFSDRGCRVDTLGDYRLGFVGWLSDQTSLDGLDQVERWRTIPEALTRKIALREKTTLFEE